MTTWKGSGQIKINEPVYGADIVEYNPVRDIDEMTAMVATKQITAVINNQSTF